MIPDFQLGEAMRLKRPTGQLARQQLDSMVRDLVGADQSLLAPLQHLIARPAFLALRPETASKAERLLASDQLLSELRETYHPNVVARLRAFLEGYLDLSETSGNAQEAETLIWGDAPLPGQVPNPVPSPQPRATPPQGSPVPRSVASTTAENSVADRIPTGGAKVPKPDKGASTPDTTQTAQAVPSPDGHGQPGTDTPAGKQRRNLPLLLGLGVVAGLGIDLVYRIPTICRPLGLCPAATKPEAKLESSSAMALGRAQKAADAMANASNLPSFESALTDLDTELLRLSGDPLTPQHVSQRNRLQGLAVEGRERLEKEQQEAQTVTQATSRINALTTLPGDEQTKERQAIAQTLSAIPARSFSYAAALPLIEQMMREQDLAKQVRDCPENLKADPTTVKSARSVTLISKVAQPIQVALMGGQDPGTRSFIVDDERFSGTITIDLTRVYGIHVWSNSPQAVYARFKDCPAIPLAKKEYNNIRSDQAIIRFPITHDPSKVQYTHDKDSW